MLGGRVWTRCSSTHSRHSLSSLGSVGKEGRGGEGGCLCVYIVNYREREGGKEERERVQERELRKDKDKENKRKKKKNRSHSLLKIYLSDLKCVKVLIIHIHVPHFSHRIRGWFFSIYDVILIGKLSGGFATGVSHAEFRVQLKRLRYRLVSNHTRSQHTYYQGRVVDLRVLLYDIGRERRE